MYHWQALEQKILQTFFKFFLVDADRITDREASRKILLMFSIASVGAFFLCFMGLVAWFRHEYLLATLDYLVALLLIGLLVYLRQSLNYVFCCYAGVGLMSLLYWYLFMSGAGAGNAFLWLYTYPLFVLYLLGSRHGALAILLFSIPCAGFLFVDLLLIDNHRYGADFALRFVPSFMAVSLFAFMFEKSGEQMRKFLMDAHVFLEQQVFERTGQLQHEIKARIANEEKLRVSEQRYRTLFDSNGDAVFIVNADGRL